MPRNNPARLALTFRTKITLIIFGLFLFIILLLEVTVAEKTGNQRNIGLPIIRLKEAYAELVSSEEALKKLIELNPKNYTAYFELGRLYQSQGKLSQAEEAFKKAIELDPESDTAYGALSVLYDEIGKPELAKEYAKKADSLRLRYYVPVSPVLSEKLYQHPVKNLKAKLRSSWRESKLYYEFTVFPFSSLAKMYDKKARDPDYALIMFGFLIKLQDRNEFTIKEIPIQLWNMTIAVDDSGNPQGASINSNIELSKDEYEAIAYFKIGWVLDKKLIPDAVPNAVPSVEDRYFPSLPIPELSLDGILYDPEGNSTANINGKTFKRYDNVGDYLLVDIKENCITLRKGKEAFDIKLKK